MKGRMSAWLSARGRTFVGVTIAALLGASLASAQAPPDPRGRAPGDSDARPGSRVAPEEALAEALARYERAEATVDEVISRALARYDAGMTSVKRLRLRARRAGLLPTVRVGARHGRGDDASAQTGSSDRVVISTDVALTLDATLTWNLSRAAYGRDEVALLREERTRARERRDLMRYVVTLFFERRRLQLERDLGAGMDAARAMRIRALQAELEAVSGAHLAR